MDDEHGETMKKLVGVVLVLAVVLLGGYYGMGMVTEQTLKKNIAMLNQSNELLVKVEQYQRHWFHSNAILHWELHIPQRMIRQQDGQLTTIPAQNFDVQMPLIIDHGPIILSRSGVRFGFGAAKAEVALPKAFADKFSSIFTTNSSKPEVHLSLFVNYLNKTHLQINIPAFKLIAKEGAQQFIWQGLINDIHLSSNFNHIDGSFTLAGLSLIKDDVNLTVNQMDTDYDLHQTEIGLFLGEADLDLASLSIAKQNEKIFNLEKLHAHSATDIENGLFESKLSLNFEKLLTNHRRYGPATLAMTIKNLDAQSLMQFNEQISKMQQGTDLEKQQAGLMLFAQLPKLISKGAELNISELNFVFPEGPLHASLQLSLPNLPSNALMELLHKVKGTAKIEVPTILVQSLMEEAAKQKLMKQSSLQQAMIRQMQESAKTLADKPNQDPNMMTPKADISQATVTDTTKQPVMQLAGKNSDELLAQAKTMASEKIAGLIQAGTFVVQKDSYLIELQIDEGQLLVNGKPFTAAMVPLV